MDELNDDVKKDGEEEEFDPAAMPEDEDELADEVVDDADESSL
jgi:hypothetical protein